MIINENISDYPYISPCGLYCKGCPSYGKTCHGCSSEDRKQNRTSKWNCSIRICCKEEHNINSCSQCDDFNNCKILGKLVKSHPKDKRFFYRHILIENLKKIREFGLEEFAKHQDTLWRCPECGGTVAFYYYYCTGCGKKQDPDTFPMSI